MSHQPPLSDLRSLPRNVWALTATSFLTDVSSELIFNLLPLFLATVLGVRTGLIGLIEGAAEAAASLLKIVSGGLSDRIGSRKWPAVAGYSLSALAKPLLALAASWPAVLALRLADRAGKGIRTAPRDALLADSIAPARRGLAFGLHRAGDTAGALAGLLAALIVVWASQGDAPRLQAATFRRLAWIAAVPALLAVIALVAGARDVPAAPPADRAPRFSLAGLEGRYRAFLIAVVVFTLGNSADAFIILRAQERGLGVIGVLGMLAAFNAVYALAAAPAGALSDRLGRRRLIVTGWLIYGLIYLGLALARTGWHIAALYALYGLYYAAFEGAARAYVADLIPADRRGAAYGLYHAAVGLAALPASLIAGVLWQGIGGWGGLGPAAPFVTGAALALIAGLLVSRLR